MFLYCFSRTGKVSECLIDNGRGDVTSHLFLLLSTTFEVSNEVGHGECQRDSDNQQPLELKTEDTQQSKRCPHEGLKVHCPPEYARVKTIQHRVILQEVCRSVVHGRREGERERRGEREEKTRVRRGS